MITSTISLSTWIGLFIASLACYRLALFLSDDVGPWRMFSKLRSFLKKEAKHNTALRKSALHEGIDCIRCDSVWVAVPIGIYAYDHSAIQDWLVKVIDVLLLCLALSSMAILWHRAFPKR